MPFRKPQVKKPRTCPVQLALMALEPTADTLDMEMGSFDLSPSALGVKGGNDAGGCHHHRYVCVACGRPLRKSAS